MAPSSNDKKIDVIKWQSAMALVQANRAWEDTIKMWGLDSQMEYEFRQAMWAAKAKFIEAQKL